MIKVGLFFCVILAIDILVGFIGDHLQANAKGGSTKEFNDLVMEDEHDVLILGSSRAKHHYDTPFLSDTLGLDIYNAGYDGNGVVLADGILELVLKRSKPKLIVFDVEPSFDILEYVHDNNHKRYIADLKPYFRTKEVGRIIKDISAEEWYKVHSGMIRYNTDIIKMAIDNVITRRINPAGYAPISGAMTKEPVVKKDKQEDIDDVKLEYVRRLIDLAIKKDVPIILVASPKYAVTSSEIMTPVRKICEEKEVPFWDYYADSIFMNHPDWFKDPMHLNATGARDFSRMIIPMIVDILQGGDCL